MTQNNFRFNVTFPFATPPSNEELLQLRNKQRQSGKSLPSAVRFQPSEVQPGNNSAAAPQPENKRRPAHVVVQPNRTEVETGNHTTEQPKSPQPNYKRRPAHAVAQPNRTEVKFGGKH